jgi:primosomal protein N' (replication factor Y)
MADGLAIGSLVRVRLRNRRVRGWVISLISLTGSGDPVGADVPARDALRPIDAVVSIGPSPDLVSLARWAAWRYAGRLRPFLLAASPPRLVRRLPDSVAAAGEARAGQPRVAPPPVVRPPAAQAPVVQAPVVQSPVAHAPAVWAPAVQAQVVLPAAAQAPAAQAEVVQPAAAQAPAAQAQVVRPAAAQAPAARAASVQAPAAQSPSPQAPAARALAARPPAATVTASGRPVSRVPATVAEGVRAGLTAGVAVLRLPPAAPRFEVVEALLESLGAADGVLLLVPERRDADVLRRRLEARDVPVAVLPDDWERAAAGGRVVVASRAGAFAPLPRLRAAAVLDAHDESYSETRVPAWSAPVVLAERARRTGAALLLVTACPSLELLALGAEVVVSRTLERSGWPPVEVLDRRSEDPRSGRYSPLLARLIRSAREREPDLAVVCVLNRTGRVRLLACGACGELVRCESCGSALHEPAGEPEGASVLQLACPRCGGTRPRLCAMCGSARLRRLRVGASAAAEELAALTGLEVGEVSAATDSLRAPIDDGPRVLVGTEAVLHRVRRASLVVFLDLDQELLAPRLRAAEQALALVARGARLLGGRGSGAGEPTVAGGRPPGRLVIQTRLVAHEVVRAVLLGDPGVLEQAERQRRSRLKLPPYAALALLSGPESTVLADRLRASGLEVGSPVAPVAPNKQRGDWLVRAGDAVALAAALADSDSRTLDVRVEVDPRNV